jgi:protein-S-isoprenylcysteine O-methyltransferase Ste14
MKTAKQLILGSLPTLVFLAVLLLCAGRTGYWQAWAYAVIGMGMNVCTRLVLRGSPEVARERLAPGKGAKSWDKALLGLGSLLTLATLVVAGLDSGRCHWEPRLAWPWAAVGAVLTVAGAAGFLAAMKENRFFSAVVRVQTDRGHTVCTTGPYRIVRHPGYASMIVGTLGMPLLLTSLWSALPALAACALLIVRTALEDNALAGELPGYADYRRATRWRLVPGVW